MIARILLGFVLLLLSISDRKSIDLLPPTIPALDSYKYWESWMPKNEAEREVWRKHIDAREESTKRLHESLRQLREKHAEERLRWKAAREMESDQ